MVRMAGLVFWILIVFVVESHCFSQAESGWSAIRARLANSEAIHSYDVSFTHWLGFYPPDVPSKDRKKTEGFTEMSEYLSYGRIVVDRPNSRVLFVHETTFERSGKQKKEFVCVGWDKGIETSLSDDRQFTSSTPRTFEMFCKFRFVPFVELSLNDFPETLSAESLDEYFKICNRAYENSTLIRHPDGSSTVTCSLSNDASCQIRFSIDPISSMPTKVSVVEINPDTNVFVRAISSANPRFEKCKEIYRIVSLEYNRPQPIAIDTKVESVGNCQFTWHQFNEESINFPIGDNALMDIFAAKEFLHQGQKASSK